MQRSFIHARRPNRNGWCKAGICAFSALTLISVGSCQRKQPEVLYVATPARVVTKMLELAQVGEGDVVYDLGCGDGRIVIAAAGIPGVRGVGVDIDPRRIRESRENATLKGVEDRVRFFEQDLFETDIREATVVMLYLDPDVLNKLKPRLLAELEPGTRVVCHRYSFSDWKPDDTSMVVIGNSLHNIFLFIIPTGGG